MRVRCPKCDSTFPAKANSRRLRCPDCGFRQDMPEGGIAAVTPEWRKSNPVAFQAENPPASRPAPGRSPAMTWLAVAVAGLLVLAALWYFVWRDDGSGGGGGDPAPAGGCDAAAHPADRALDRDCTGVFVDFINPGVWTVSNTTDAMMVWIHNAESQQLAYTWALTGPDGGPLPAGWSVRFDTPSGSLVPRIQQPTGRNAPDYAMTMATLTIPADAEPGDHQVELRAGGAVRQATVRVAQDMARVAVSGEHAMTHYDLKKSTGEDVQVGDFCVTLGPRTNAVAGYGWGVIGLAQGETVTLVVPPPFAYGFSGSPLSGDVLRWTTTLTGWQANC